MMYFIYQSPPFLISGPEFTLWVFLKEKGDCGENIFKICT